jgi:hypothetical protein
MVASKRMIGIIREVMEEFVDTELWPGAAAFYFGEVKSNVCAARDH